MRSRLECAFVVARFSLAVASIAFACALAACANHEAASDLGGGDLASAHDLAPAPCSDPNPPDGGVCPLSVSGQVVDEAGASISSLTTSVCAGLCFFGMTDASGRFTITPDVHVVPAEYAVELHGRPDRVSYYTPLPNGAGAQLTFAQPLVLPLLPASGAPIAGDASAQTLMSGDVTITIAQGTKVLFDVEDFGTPHGHDLRVLAIAQPTKLPFVNAATPPAALYACAPFETAFDHKVALSIVNHDPVALPANAAVDVQLLGGLVNDSPPAGLFHHAALAHVSADGTTITTDAGEGITELTWIALIKM